MENEPCSGVTKIPRHTILQLLREIQRKMEYNTILHEKFDDGMIFMSMYNDVDWRKTEKQRNLCRVLQVLLRTPEDFLKDIGHYSDQELKKIGKDAHLQTKLFVEPCCPPDDG